MTTNVAKQQRTVKRIPAHLNPRPRREESVASFADVFAMSRSEPDDPRDVNPRPDREDAAVNFADIYARARTEPNDSEEHFEDQNPPHKRLGRPSTRSKHDDQFVEEWLAEFREMIEEYESEHESEAEHDPVGDDDRDSDDVAGCSDEDYFDHLSDYEDGIVSAEWMRQHCGERFTAEHEAAFSPSRVPEHLETRSAERSETSSSHSGEPGDEHDEDGSPSIGSPSLLRWTKRRGMVGVPADFVRITRNAEQAIILAQLCYWFDIGKNNKQRANFHRYGRVWEPKTHADWSKETGIAESRVKAAIKALCDLGFVERQYAKVKGARTTLLRPLPEVIAQACGYRAKNPGQNKSA